MAFVHIATPYTMAVVRRQYIVWLKLIWSSLAIIIANPILFLFAFGFGLGRFIDAIGGVSYLVYVVPGMVAYSAMFAASFETTIGSFSRFYMVRTWDATLATPVTLSELLFGEVLWASLKAVLAAVSVLIVGWLWGGIPEFTDGLIALPIIFVASVGFACYCLLATSLARSYEFFAYFFTFWVTPMFIFSGVFFEIEVFPLPVQIIAWVLPMTHLVAIIRPLTAGLPLDLGMVAVHLGYTMLLSVTAFTFAYRRIRKRMFD